LVIGKSNSLKVQRECLVLREGFLAKPAQFNDPRTDQPSFKVVCDYLIGVVDDRDPEHCWFVLQLTP